MLARQLELLAETHRNHFLFSDYYLNHRVHAQSEWREADVRAGFEHIAAVWRDFSPQSDNEAQTELEWIRPVLRALGHTFNVQVSLQTPLGTHTPDYVFFPDQASRLAAKAMGGPLTEEDLRAALAVGDAKAWERPLDRSPGHKSTRLPLSENPSFQMDFYIRHSGAAWGVLTNGRRWRLYHRDSSKQLDVYYEVDLPALIEQGDMEAFKFFYLFFRREAFLGSPAWLERVLQESRAYAQGVGESLKEQVYEALRCLAQGWLDFPGNGLTPAPATLQAIHDHSLIVLYRLLFILYAESRGLLPVDENPAYTQNYSLLALKRRVARAVDTGAPSVPSMDTLWHQLRQLWRVLNSGDAHLGVPAYNGGLFDPHKHPWLEQYRVGDSHLQQALDLLTRTPDPATGKREFVDYRDLEIRHLGSIYEGLLEYRLRVAETPLVVRTERGREVYAPVEQDAILPHSPDVAPGQVYLVTDKGERKATGSYYTPDYVVQYIVEQSVGPALDEIRARYTAADGSITDEAGLTRALLEINVLDPAMGSGHFLVAATDFIARTIVALGLSRAGAPGAEGELAYWRRRVAQACVYGVDLNPLAVELAKLSLWLATVARDKPLSFLDHHLRCGDSLVGARVSDLLLDAAPQRSRRRERVEQQARAAGQLSMLDDSAFVGAMRTATRFMDDIEALSGDSLDDVQQAERIYRQVAGQVTRQYRTLADVWTARHFGLALDDAAWSGLARHAARPGFEVPQYAQIVAQASQIAGERRFFHWELEFPEVFFDRHGRLLAGRAGFDAVIGNPPYVRQEELAALKPYFESALPQVYAGTADLFVYFFGQGLELLRAGGRLAYIASNSWLRANYATPLRAHLRAETTVETLVDLGDNRVFADAPDVYPAIHVVRRGPPPAGHAAQAAVFGRGEGVADFAQQLAGKRFSVSIHDQSDSGWQLEDDASRRLFAKLMAAGRPLGQVVNGQMYRGVLTGLNEAFIVDQATRERLVRADPRSAEVLKPMLRGEDLRPWYQEDEGRWLIFARRGTDIDAYPAVKAYLEQFRERLEPRPLDWDRSRHWPGRKPGSYRWYEIQDAVDYYPAFEKPKIFWPELAKTPRFSWDTDVKYVNNKGYIAPFEDPWLLGVLNSRTIWFVIMKTCLGLGERAGMERFQLFAQYISNLPIPDALPVEREAIGGLALALTEHARARYALQRQTRHRVLADLGGPGGKLNQKLTAWWELDFGGLRREVQKAFERDVPLRERDEWEAWLAGRRVEHERLTAEMVRLETELNGRVYALFGLTAREVRVIEEGTKYRYGEG